MLAVAVLGCSQRPKQDQQKGDVVQDQSPDNQPPVAPKGTGDTDPSPPAVPREIARDVPPDVLGTDEDDAAHVVRVFYATDRLPADKLKVRRGALHTFRFAIAASAVTLVLGLLFARYRRLLLSILCLLALGATVKLYHMAGVTRQRQARLEKHGDPWYTSERNEVAGKYVLEMGECQVRIPPDHRVGRVESPSILRLEFREDPQRHVILERVIKQEAADFFGNVKSTVEQSPARQAFVFVHGYNVGFDTAVMRTAQIAHDLKFQGAPICYSWPSKGGVAEYTRDEANVGWSVLHLEQFLTDLREQTGANTIHLVAHSMGNRSVLQVLERMALKPDTPRPAFGQLILAAPDVDASEFRDRYAPAARELCGQITLYASSNDRALQASTKVHGFTRAGLSGDHLLALTGIETVDVSPIDTSLIGHSYYGNNPLMIRDLRALVELGSPASAREWLERMLRNPDEVYWTFRANYSE
jgi:esterase/lipase superfamily enzyme